MAIPAGTTPMQYLDVIINKLVARRDKLIVYLDDSGGTLSAAQKSAVATAITQVKAALDDIGAALQAL